MLAVIVSVGTQSARFSPMNEVTKARTIRTDRGSVTATVAPNAELGGWGYHLVWSDGQEETGTCDTPDPWDAVYARLSVPRATEHPNDAAHSCL